MLHKNETEFDRIILESNIGGLFMIRKIVEINKELCNGCGACASACHEGAIEMIDGKATLIKDDYCDGFGDCLPACPTNAITIIEREAAEYDEEAVLKRMNERKNKHQKASFKGTCPGSMAMSLARDKKENTIEEKKYNILQSQLMQWPVQIKLIPIKAPYYENADLLIAADCSAYAYAGFHEDFIKNHITIIGCPKLDMVDYSEKLTEIIKNNNIKSIKVVRMEVPCCGGIERATMNAIANSNKNINCEVVTITCDGKVR